MKKKKVLFLITSLSLGGAEKHVLSLAKELLSSDEFTPIIASLAEDGSFYDQVVEAGIPVLTLKRKFRYDIFIAFQLSRILKKEKISILHTHMFYSNMVGRFSGKMAHTPVVISTEHGQSIWKNKLLIWIDHITQRYVDKIITVSELSKSIRLTREKIVEDKLTTIHNFVNINEFSHVQKEDINLKNSFNIHGSHIIGMLTRLNENKRVQDAILAMKIVTKSHPLAKLVVLGEGPIKSELIELSKEQCVKKNIVFTGFQSNTTEWLSIFDIFLSISRREDFPISILEAMAMAKPVIATNVGGIPEIIKGQTGILIEPENPSILADKIIWMLEHPDETKNMGLAGKEVIKTRFSQDVIVPQIISLYKNCLAEKRV